MVSDLRVDCRAARIGIPNFRWLFLQCKCGHARLPTAGMRRIKAMRSQRLPLSLALCVAVAHAGWAPRNWQDPVRRWLAVPHSFLPPSVGPHAPPRGGAGTRDVPPQAFTCLDDKWLKGLDSRTRAALGPMASKVMPCAHHPSAPERPQSRLAPQSLPRFSAAAVPTGVEAGAVRAG